MTPEYHHKPDDALIHAWLDGALDPQSKEARHARTLFDTDPELAARIKRDREADGLLASALNAYARTNGRQPVIENAVQRAGRMDQILRGGVAAALVLTLFSGGWFTHALTHTSPSALEADAAQLAYLEGEISLTSVSFDSDGVHEPVMEPPRLTGLGLNLTFMETRLVDGGILNRMEYQRSDGTWVRILVRSENRVLDQAITTTNVDGLPLVYWRDGNMTVGITGPASEQELERIAVEVREQTRPASSGPSLAENILSGQDALPGHEVPVQTLSDSTIPSD